MNFSKYVCGTVMGAALILFSGTSVAQDRDRDNRDRHEDQRRGDDRDRHEGRGEYHFRTEDRDHFSRHYEKDIRQWNQHPDRRHHLLRAGDRIPTEVRLRSVPTSYYRTLPPPPPGYRFGYYDGYVVAYDPTTRIVADILDLVNSGINR